jgi:hypothetical protein
MTVKEVSDILKEFDATVIRKGITPPPPTYSTNKKLSTFDQEIFSCKVNISKKFHYPEATVAAVVSRCDK